MDGSSHLDYDATMAKNSIRKNYELWLFYVDSKKVGNKFLQQFHSNNVLGCPLKKIFGLYIKKLVP